MYLLDIPRGAGLVSEWMWMIRAHLDIDVSPRGWIVFIYWICAHMVRVYILAGARFEGVRQQLPASIFGAAVMLFLSLTPIPSPVQNRNATARATTNAYLKHGYDSVRHDRTCIDSASTKDCQYQCHTTGDCSWHIPRQPEDDCKGLRLILYDPLVVFSFGITYLRVLIACFYCVSHNL